MPGSNSFLLLWFAGVSASSYALVTLAKSTDVLVPASLALALVFGLGPGLVGAVMDWLF